VREKSQEFNIDRVVRKMPSECWIILAAMLGRSYPFTYEAKQTLIKDMAFPINGGN